MGKENNTQGHTLRKHDRAQTYLFKGVKKILNHAPRDDLIIFLFVVTV